MTGAAGIAGGEPAVPAPELRQLRRSAEGYDAATVEEAFEAFRRQIAALQAEIYELRTEKPPAAYPLPGEASRAEALRLVQAGAELAQAIEHDARQTAATQLAFVEEELAARRSELDEREAALEQERRRVLEAAEDQARAQLAEAERRAADEIAQAEARAQLLYEQARLQVEELRAAARDDGEPLRAEVGPAGPRAEDAMPVEDAPEAAPGVGLLAPPLSPEDLAANGPQTFRSDPTHGL